MVRPALVRYLVDCCACSHRRQRPLGLRWRGSRHCCRLVFFLLCNQTEAPKVAVSGVREAPTHLTDPSVQAVASTLPTLSNTETLAMVGTFRLGRRRYFDVTEAFSPVCAACSPKPTSIGEMAILQQLRNGTDLDYLARSPLGYDLLL
jgi:hypothetical protein